jgi:hypothetical protein
MALVLALVWVLAAGAAPPAEVQRFEAALVDSRDLPVRLSSYRGKPLVLFFEDRASADQNARLKRALHERPEARRFGGTATILGVADVSAYDFWPARDFVFSAIRDVEKRDKVQVLLDWKKVLREPPWSLPEGTSSVVLLDAQGHWVHAWSGAVEGAEEEHFFEVLVGLVEGSAHSAVP